MTKNNELVKIRKFHNSLKNELHRIIVGYDELIDLMTISLLSDGNILLEGVPGTAKTSICKMFAKNISGVFGRLQGSVDIQPADVIGLRIYNKDLNEFHFNKGPIFSNILLIDEINRLTPKSQAALLESLAERQVTIDNIKYSLPTPFMVIATQNPYEMEGTFQLIEAQKDRFMFTIQIEHLSPEEECEILRRDLSRTLDLQPYLAEEQTLVTTEDIFKMQNTVRNIHASEGILEYISDITLATRSHSDVKLGISTRGSLALLRGVQAYAALQDRDYVIPDDVKFLVPYALGHRIILKREATLGGITVESILNDILNTVTVK